MKLNQIFKITVSTFLVLTMLYFVACKKEPDPIPEGQGIFVSVKDALNNQPLGGACVSVNEPTGCKTTNTTTGSVDFGGLINKNYRVYVSKEGYVAQNADIIVEPKKKISYEVNLKPIINFEPARLDFGANEKIKKFDIVNNSEKAINYSISESISWATFEPTTGSIPQNGREEIRITIDDKGLVPLKYSGKITIDFGSVLQSKTYEISIVVPNAEAPSVTSDKPTSITPTTAQITGTITSVGKGTISKYGHVWGENANPTCCVPNFNTDLGSRSVGSYVSTLTGLVKGKTYFVRAYAQNEKGINYSYNDEYNFTTPTTATEPSVSIGTVDVISTTSAKATGRINDNGGSTIVEYGHVWSKTNPTPDPESEKTKTSFTGEPTNGEFISNITNLLEPNTKYYIVAYAKNSSPKPLAKSAVLTFNTPLPVTEPKLTTSAATDIDYTSVTLKGSVTELGSSKIVENGFVYSKSNADPKINAKNSTFKNLGNLSNPNPISTSVSGLLKGMSYYYRTYVKTENGDYYYASVVRNLVTKEDGRIVHYIFNGDAEDLSGNGNNGNSNAQLTVDRFENPNKAYDLSKGTIQMLNNAIGSFTGELTFSFWVKLSESNFNGNKKVLIGKDAYQTYNGTGYNGYFFMIDSQKSDSFIFWYKIASSKENYVKICSKEDIGDNKWHQLIATKSAKILRFFLDGDEIRQPATIDYDNIVERLNPISMGNILGGCCWDAPLSQINASIDDFRIYNATFSPTQVLELYNREK